MFEMQREVKGRSAAAISPASEVERMSSGP